MVNWRRCSLRGKTHLADWHIDKTHLVSRHMPAWAPTAPTPKGAIRRQRAAMSSWSSTDHSVGGSLRGMLPSSAFRKDFAPPSANYSRSNVFTLHLNQFADCPNNKPHITRSRYLTVLPPRSPHLISILTCPSQARARYMDRCAGPTIFA